MLKNFSAEVNKYIRKEDSCSRHGMSQLMIVRQDAGAEDARQFCFQLAKELKTERIAEGALADLPTLNISAGFAEASLGATFDDVLAEAGSRESTFLEFKIK
jgi:GGDEF domain-containing protein